MTVSINGTSGIVNDATDLNYTGTLTGGTGVVDLGSGQVYKDASGKVGIGTSSPNYKFNVGSTDNVPSLTGAGISLFSNSSLTSNIGGVLNFRPGLGQTASDIFNLSICAYDHSADGNADGLSINGADGVSFSTGGNSRQERARIDSSGNLLVGTTSALSQTGRATFVSSGNALVTQVANGNTAFQSTNTSGTSAYYAAIWGNNGNSFSTCGTIQVSGSNTSYNTSSDYRLKEDVQPMTGALAKVARLKPVTYKWKSDGTDSEGFIAHELAEICPHAVSGEKDALKEDGSIMPQGIDTSFLVATLTAAIQEQQTLITALTARITALEGTAA